MKFLTKKIRNFTVAVAALLAFGLACTAVASADSGGSQNNQSTSPVLYSSLVSPYSAQNPPNEWWSLSFGGTNATQFGDKINLGSSSHLGSATVMLDSQAVGTGTFPVPITFTFYQPGTTGGSVGAVLATQTKTFNVPYRPAGNAAACGVGTNSIFAGASNDGTQWLDPATGTCYYGVVYPATFTFRDTKLPSTVVYGVSYNATSGPASSLNVLLSTESASGAVTVGSDTDPSNLFVQAGSATNALGGPSGQITCSPVGTTFQEYNTAVGSTGCGTDTQQSAGAPYEPIGFVPALEIDSNSRGN
ncbi:MAG TPA: hypothetical protein VGZ68_11240 [Acidimicrobiales bacterium]|jgi:hypothetical protein|nr:hypothetical protein [Acidimicrobiales bacterium]